MRASNMTATEEAHWVAMAQSGQLRMHLIQKEVVRPVSPRSAPSDKKIPEAQVGTATYSAESGSHPDAPGIKKGLGLGVPVVRKPGARGVVGTPAKPPHPHHWRLSEPSGPVTHGRCKACGAEREFSTAGLDVMPLTLLSKANLAKRGLATRFKKAAG